MKLLFLFPEVMTHRPNTNTWTMITCTRAAALRDVKAKETGHVKSKLVPLYLPSQSFLLTGG